MLIRSILILLFCVVAIVVTSSMAVSLIFILLYFIGIFILRAFKQKDHGKNIFFISFVSYFFYALLLFMYMTAHHYEFMQSIDGNVTYIPYTKALLNSGSFSKLVSSIYSAPRYAFVGSILVLFVYISKLAIMLGGDIYIPIQISILLFASLTNVVIYNILTYNGIVAKTAYKYTILYSLLSIQFLMATYIVRDMPITLFFTVIIFLSFKPYSFKNILLMVMLILLIMSIRISSGVFACIYIFLTLFISSGVSKMKVKKLSRYVILAMGLLLLIGSINQITSLFESKHDQYAAIAEQDQGGNSTFTAFNILPPGVRQLSKAAYNQFMPIPSWRTMIKTSYRPECYNVMNFPMVTAVLFKYIMWCVIIIGFCNEKIRSYIKSHKLLFYNFLIGILFLMVQSTTLGDRRMMGVYPVFFLVSILIYLKFDLKRRKLLVFLGSFLFFALQLVGAYYLS